MPVTQVAEGATLTQDELDTFMLVNALGVAETRDDGRVIYEVPEELAGYGLPANLTGSGLQELFRTLPRLPEPLGLPDLSGQSSMPPHAEPMPVQEQAQPQPSMSKATMPMPSGPPGDEPPQHDRPLCEHLRVTTRGSNAYYTLRRCLDCGMVLSRERRESTVTGAMPKGGAVGPVGHVFHPDRMDCPHHSVTWAGTNAFQWRRTCRACGEVRTGPVAGAERLRTSGRSGPGLMATGPGLAANNTGHGLSAQAPGLGLQTCPT